uniref:Adenylate kinase n=1 Tax=uncultured Microgenomates bacterium Rifle_16ft_4_minimus_24053 TaxID=1665110 RepID=A0A0H4TEV2_9BACT|nr:adenylate kinase, adenylate kinase [uncultured Microgenomates bacterium Rifle_16ft_4_minimus_24053]
MNIVILGAPGSGKGTQSELLANKLNLFYFQTGELARELAKKDKRIREIVDSGRLIPKEEMTMYALDNLKESKSNYKDILFEGFPRFISQYEALEKFLELKGDGIDAVISLDISEREAVRRLSARRICENCGEIYNLITTPPPEEGKCGNCGGKLVQRADDKPESIKVRFSYYKDNTEKLIDYLDRKKKLIRIDGERPIEVIFKDILQKLKVKDARKH